MPPAAAAAPAHSTRGAATASTSAPSSPSDPNLDDVPTDVSTLEPGATFTRTRAFTAHDVASFASITGDHNPIHVDPDAARIAGFEHGPVVHGMLCASMFGAIIGTKFPGAVYATQSLSFRKPVRVNEVVRAEVEVLDREVWSDRRLDGWKLVVKVCLAVGVVVEWGFVEVC